MANAKILVIDDDAVACEFLQGTLVVEGYTVDTSSSAREALVGELSQYDIVLSDIRMPDMDGLTALKLIRERRPDLPVVLMTSFGSLETTMEALRHGAWDYISKPFSPAEIRALVRKVLEFREFGRAKIGVPVASKLEPHLIGSSAPMVEIYKQLSRIANSEASVLIEGESGTGKELAARSLHQMSIRANKPLMVLNCGAVPETLLESELFGYEKGAFTGADKAHPGLFEAAQDGTVFLDEITEMSPSLQAKLLRFLQNGEVRRVGGNETKIISVRVVAASNKDIDAEVVKEMFRPDLLYRFVVRLKIPPLRERKADIPLLVESLLKKIGCTNIRVSDEAMRLLIAYDWPGNVRELENMLRQVTLMTPYSLLLPENFPQRLRKQTQPTPFSDTLSPLEAAQYQSIVAKLAETSGNLSKTAAELGIDRKTLRAKMKRYGMAKP